MWTIEAMEAVPGRCEGKEDLAIGFEQAVDSAFTTS